MKQKKPFYKKKKYIIPLIVILSLLLFRIFLPTLVKNYVNKTLTNIPGYYGQVEDIDISLYRGAYVIRGLYLNKVNAGTQIPFMNFPQTDISIEWKSLFKGEIVSEIIMNSPEIIYIEEDHATTVKDNNTEIEDWTIALTDLVPLDINHFEILNGKIAYVQLTADPDIDLTIEKLNLTADNLRNVVEKERVLPSPIKATAVSFGGGTVELNGNMNIIKKIPDMDLNFSLEKANATALNEFTNYFAGIDFESGVVELYSEIAIADGHLKGYMKPLLINSKLHGTEDGFLETLWEGFVGFLKFAFKNQKTDTLATQIPLEGDLNNLEAEIWSTIGGIFKNAWISAFRRKTDETIEFKDAFQDDKEFTEKEKNKKNTRRE